MLAPMVALALSLELLLRAVGRRGSDEVGLLVSYAQTPVRLPGSCKSAMVLRASCRWRPTPRVPSAEWFDSTIGRRGKPDY